MQRLNQIFDNLQWSSNIENEYDESATWTTTFTNTTSVNIVNVEYVVSFYDEEGEIGFKLGQWSFAIDGADASSLVQTDTTDVEQNQIRVRFIGSEDYMGKTLKVSYSSVTGIVSNVDIQISGA